MGNFVAMHVFDGIQHLRYYFAYKFLLSFEMSHESSILHVLHQQKYVILVMEMCVEFCNIGVIAGQSVMNS